MLKCELCSDFSCLQLRQLEQYQTTALLYIYSWLLLSAAYNTYLPYLQALGSMYFIHNTLKDIYQYDFNGKVFVLSGMTPIFITLFFSSPWVSFNAHLVVHTH